MSCHIPNFYSGGSEKEERKGSFMVAGWKLSLYFMLALCSRIPSIPCLPRLLSACAAVPGSRDFWRQFWGILDRHFVIMFLSWDPSDVLFILVSLELCVWGRERTHKPPLMWHHVKISPNQTQFITANVGWPSRWGSRPTFSAKSWMSPLPFCSLFT